MAHFVISVPEQESEDLSLLEGSLGIDLDAPSISEVEVRSLDGETVAVIVVALTSQAIQAVAQWLVARARARKSTSVTFDGVTVTADSVEDVERVVASLRLRKDAKKLPVKSKKAIKKSGK